MSISDGSKALLDAAQSYRNRDWRVIELHRVGPDGRTCSCKRGGNCSSAGKHPRNNEWQKAAPLSGADIQAVWDVDKAPNIGLATGAESGFWVLDIDPKDGGMESMTELVAPHGKLPATFTVKTGSGGYHYYFAMPDGVEIRNSQKKLARGIDVRGTGGQVVAAPSRTDKGVYTVIKDCDPVYAPSWLLDLVRKEHHDEEVLTAEDLPKPEDIAPAEWDRLNTYSRKVIDAEIGRLDKLKVTGWQGEPWDATTFQVSCTLVEMANSPWNAYSLGQAEADVLAHAPRDQEGFDTWKVKQKFSSAREKVGDKVRPIPESRRDTASDDLFDGPDVQDRTTPDPTGGDEAEESPRRQISPEVFFDGKNGLDTALLGQAIAAQGPLGFGKNRDWWRYENGAWRYDENVIRRRCKQLLGGRLRRIHSSEAAEWLEFDESTYHISGAPHQQWMNFRNGMLDWQTGELVEHAPEFLSTTQFPLDYNPDATCPAFDRFLTQVMHDDYVSMAWEMIGYLMLSGNPLQVAFLLYGTGGNGKGTLTRIIEDILGRENIANEPLDRLNGDKFSLVNLFGKIANIAGDIDATYQESTAAFKRLTGEDTMLGEQKYGKHFYFQNWAVPLFSANKIPGSSDVSEGYLRRWVVLHFHKRITDPIPGLSDVLATELEGIAAKAVLALRDLMKRNNGRGGFDPQGEALKGQREFAESIDQVRQWLAGGGVQQAPEHHEPLDKLYAEYSVWVARTNRGRINEQEFSHRLEAAGYPRNKLAGAPHHAGLRVQPIKQHQPTDDLF